MSVFELTAAVISLAAVFSYLNHRIFRLPTTIGVMLIAQLFSLGLVAAGYFRPEWLEQAKTLINSIDFDAALLQGMLGALLFAGALHVEWNDLRRQKWTVGTLATAGTLASTAVVGAIFKLAAGLFGLDVPWIVAFVFGALISPTDPIAVLGLLKKLHAPKWLETKIAGESLFNDGVGVVIFLALTEIAFGGHELEASHVGLLFLQEVAGGAVFGMLVGLAAYAMVRRVDNYQVEILISLAVAVGGYALALALHLSGPIAMVVAGLFLGNRGRQLGMSEQTNQRLDEFWELIDEIMNVVLFVLLGLELLILDLQRAYLLLGAAMVVGVLFGRLVAIQGSLLVLRRFQAISRGTGRILVWGGLRGGISVALALSLPSSSGETRDVLLTVTYVVVTFSIVVQGLTISSLMKRIDLRDDELREEAAASA